MSNQEDKTVISHSCPQCGQSFPSDQESCPTDGQPLVSPNEQIRILSPGSVFLDKYEIVCVLGSGGMGVVYKARHQLLQNLVAIKTLRSDYAIDEQTQQRFFQEAKLTSSLSHPHIASVFDFGYESESKQPYIIMDFVDGTTLSAILRKEGSLPVERAMYIFSQVCEAMSHAHAHGILHRDLKPGNIMLMEHPEHGADYVKIVDFGIAKIKEVEGGEKSQALTRSGEVFGSPYYMSPEQCAGKQLDDRSDIYSLGCVMYEALTGSLPLSGENTVETMFAQMNVEPNAFRLVRPDLYIPDELESIVKNCMAKEPSRRPAAMGVLKEELDELAQEVGSLKPKKHRPLVFVSKRTKMLLINAALLLASGAGMWFWLSYSVSTAATRIDSLYLDPAEEAMMRKEYAEALTLYETALTESKKVFGGKRIEAVVLDHLGLYYQERENYPEAVKYFEQELEIRRSDTNVDLNVLANANFNVAVQYFNMRNDEQAAPYFDRAITLYRTTKNKPRIVDCAAMYGELMLRGGRFDTGIRLIQEAKRHASSIDNK